MKEFCIVIPAIKKNGVIPDQLIKKLNGVTLIQRAIDTARKVGKDIFIVTDSQEISLISERNGVEYIYNANYKISPDNLFDNFRDFLKEIEKKYLNIIIYRANTPLVNSEIIFSAYQQFLKDSEKTLVSVKEEEQFSYENENGQYFRKRELSLSEINSFIIISSKNLFNRKEDFDPYIISSEKAIEIESFQDWWIAEKLLQRKKIVIHVFGSVNLGMGHIYRSLALAHEITTHQVIFVCDEKYKLAVNKIASMDYRVISTKDVEQTILEENPDLIINDVLNTDKNFIQNLKKISKVVNFEDLGTGSSFTDITINELYEHPVKEGDNYLWGSDYYFLRDEFDNAKPHQFLDKVNSLLISFGGTDRNNLTMKTLISILPLAEKMSIYINIVCGGGYLFREDLEKYIDSLEYKNIHLTFESGTISKIMESSQIAISSNGRTVYELADMNIPTIVISQHEREVTHSFSTLERGFLNLGVVRDGIEKEIKISFEKLILDSSYRELLFLNIQNYGFRKNKKKVVNLILELLE